MLFRTRQTFSSALFLPPSGAKRLLWPKKRTPD